MVVGVEPPTPEPIEVHAGRIFHRPEQVGRGGALEGPAAAVLLEGEIEELPAHHGLPQDVEGGGRLAVGVGAKLEDAFRVGHDGGNPLRITTHVARDLPGWSTAGWVVPVELLFGEVLHEGVQAFVHPRPLALIGVDDHRVEVVAHLVDDHGDHAVLGASAVGAVGLRASAVEADHRVLHADPLRVDADGHGVGVLAGEFAVGQQRLGHGLRAVLFPERIALLGVVAHGQRRAVLEFNGHGVPDELPAGGKGEIANVLRLEPPSGQSLLLGLLVFPGFLLGDDEDRLVRGLGLFEAGPLLGREDLLGILQNAGRRHDVVTRHRDAHVVVSELERELAAAEELLVLPSHPVVVRTEAGEELGNGIQVVVLLREMLVAASAAVLHAVVDVVPPIHLEGEFAARGQGLGQVDAHHGLVDGVGEGLAAGVLDRFNLETTIEIRLEVGDAVKGHPVLHEALADHVAVAVEVPHVLVELEPEVAELVRAVVDVGDGLLAVDALAAVVQADVHHVVHSLLPVLVPRSPAGRAHAVGRGEHVVELAEGVVVRVAFELGTGRHGHGDKPHEEGKAKEILLHRVVCLQGLRPPRKKGRNGKIRPPA